MYRVEPVIYRRAAKGRVGFIDTMDANYLSHVLYEATKKPDRPHVSIGILGYRHIEDTKRCVESVLRFIGDVDFELILMDNGSDDDNETLEYYQSVPTMRKKIIQVEEALGPDYGAVFGTRLLYEYSEGDIFIFCGNDNIITENAIQNIITCLESSPDIGMATSMSDNAWMAQNPGLVYSNADEMFAAAKAFNKSDPRKWKERLIVTPAVATGIKREVLIQTGIYGLWSAEDDLCYKIRRAGYKIILLGDTWVCHNHNYNTKKDSHGWLGNEESGQKRLHHLEQMNKANMGGLNLFDDIMTFEYQLISMLSKPKAARPKLLAINVTAGQALLDMKNKLREYGVFDTQSTAFTTDAKYYTMLATTAGQTLCDRIQFLQEDLEGQKFDMILLGEPVNLFPNPAALLKVLLELLEPDGQLLFKLKNSWDMKMLQGILDGAPKTEGTQQMILSPEDIQSLAAQYGASQIKIQRSIGNYLPETVRTIVTILMNTKAVKDIQQAVENIITTDYLFWVEK